MIVTHEKLKEDIRADILRTLKEEKSGNIENLVYVIMSANVSGNEKKAKKYSNILLPRLASLGYDRNSLMSMSLEIRNITNEKEADKFIAKYKLSDEYISKHKMHTYKIIVTVPFSTSSNKEEKEKELKYNLVINDIKLLGIKELRVSSIGPAGSAGEAIDLKYLIKIKTMSDVEDILQNHYSIDKIKEEGIGKIIK